MASAASIVAPKLSQAALARELDVSRQAVNDLVKRGILPIDKDGLIDVELARHAIANRVRPSGKTAAALNGASPAAAPADSEATANDSAPITSYYVAKTLREAAEAKMANLRLAEMECKLIDKDRASAGAFTAFRQLRDALGVLPRKVAPAAAVATDVREVEALIARAIREALDLFANRTLPELLAAVGADAADAGKDAAP